MKRFALVVLLAASCASAPPAQPPDWTAIPPGVVEALCAKLRSEAISSDSAIAIVGTTEPLITPASIRSLGESYGRGMGVLPLAAPASEAPLPVTVASSSSCTWMHIDRLDTEHHVDVMVVQISRPVINPYAPAEAGLFARFTVGGRDAQWYWIPIAERKGRWLVGYVIPLATRE